MAATFVGFDSAWTDNPTLPGAICSVVYDGRRFGDFKEPTLVRFGQALDFVRDIHAPGQLTLVAPVPEDLKELVPCSHILCMHPLGAKLCPPPVCNSISSETDIKIVTFS